MKNNMHLKGGNSFYRKFNDIIKYLSKLFNSLNDKKMSYLALLIIVLSNLPFIILTINTGLFSDDYQFFNLFHLKQIISPLGRSIIDIIEPKTDFHLTSFWYFFNVIVHRINESPKFYHLVICLINIGTSLIIYFIVTKIYRNNKIALLSAILFSLSYSLCYKALTWNTFSSTAINTFTGAFSLFFLIKYFGEKRYVYLFASFILLTLTILNLESGFVFFVILGTYAIYNFIISKISMNILLETFIMIFLTFSIYAGLMMYFTGHPVPLFFARSNVNTNQELTEKIIGQRENVNENNNMGKKSLTITEMRSTYAPRTLPVIIMRTVDLSMKLFNLSIIEDLAKSRFYSSLSNEKKIAFKKRIRPFIKKAFIIFGLLLLFVLPLFIYIGYHALSKDSYPLLLILIFLFPVYIIIFNRVDIANSLGIFSSIIIADFFISTRKKVKLFRYFSSGIMFVFFGLASLAIIDGFETTYFYKKSYRMKISEIYDHINKKIGNYTDNTILLVDSKSIIASPSMNYKTSIPLIDLSHLNAFVYKNEFIKTQLAQNYKNKSFNDFIADKDLHNNIRAILANEINQQSLLKYKNEYNCVIHIDKNNNIILLKGNA